MSRAYRLFVLFSFAVCVYAMAPAQDQTQPTPRIVTAKIKLDDFSMIIVPVSINGSGPYDFLLDTGCGRTMLDQKLVDELALPRVGERTIAGVLASAAMPIVRATSISVGGASVADMSVSSSKESLIASSKVRGVLGEDFLKNFDVMVDYHHHTVQLESDTNSLATTVSGQRLPLQLSGIYRGKVTPNRLIVSGKIDALGGKPMSVLLDSGTNQFILFQDNLGPEAIRTESLKTGSFSAWKPTSAAVLKVRSLNLGDSFVPDLTVVALSHPLNTDTDAIAPTSLFRSIFISHREKFVILNPAFPKASR